MPSSNESAYLNLALLAYRPKTARELEFSEEVKKFRKLAEIRRGYKGEWNSGARYFYSELIRAYGLDDEWRESLMELAKPTPGRKHSVKKAVQIALLKRQGMTAKQIAEKLECNGDAISIEGVESYSKRRRKRSVAETVRAAMKAPK
jgi:DNA-binding NarL/FixJ family response regulator